MNKEVRRQIIRLLQPKMERFSISERELNNSFDLVKSGFVNSLEFVELITTLEKHFQVEIDFDTALDSGDFTTFSGLVRNIEKLIHE